jgi:hypothetical protein
MRPRSHLLQLFLVLILTVVGCVEPKVSKAPSAKSMAGPIQVRSADLAVALIRINEKGDKGALIKGPGWREYVFEIENLSTNDLTVQNVKLLNQDGRYVNSASAYEEITAPPNVGVEPAGDVAETAAGWVEGSALLPKSKDPRRWSWTIFWMARQIASKSRYRCMPHNVVWEAGINYSFGKCTSPAVLSE